jgi:hypothetical protein
LYCIYDDFVVGRENTALCVFLDRLPFDQSVDVVMHVLVVSLYVAGKRGSSRRTGIAHCR